MAGYLAQHYGWRLLYVFGTLGVVLGILAMFLLKEPDAPEAREQSSFEFAALRRSSEIPWRWRLWRSSYLRATL